MSEEEEALPEKQEVEGSQLQSRQLNPSDLLQQAVKGNADVEVMERLMSLQERWEEREAKKAFDRAFSELRSDLPEIKKDHQVDHKGASYQYETLSDLSRALSPVMAKHGLSFRWNTDTKGTEVHVECIISHEDGHSESNRLAAELDRTGSKNHIQGIGSALTYLQRYSLKAAVGIAPAPDDDAQSVDTPESYKDEGQSQSYDQQDDRETAPCPDHPNQTLVKREGDDGDTWWSHQLDNGDWCNADPSFVEEEADPAHGSTQESESGTSTKKTLADDRSKHNALEAFVKDIALTYEDDDRKDEKVEREKFKIYLNHLCSESESWESGVESMTDVPVKLAEKVLDNRKGFEIKYRNFMQDNLNYSADGPVGDRLAELQDEGVPF